MEVDVGGMLAEVKSFLFWEAENIWEINGEIRSWIMKNETI